MTTRLHIVNFGPDVVQIESPYSGAVKLYPQDSANVYVYENNPVLVRELKPEAPKQS